MNDAVSTRLLVIDDDNLVRAALTDMLQTAGFDVVTASNGRLGLELLETTPVDAVITDILMPEQEGLETIREARQRFPDIRILAISGGGSGGGETQLLRFAESFGADQTLPKPFTGSQLVAAVRTLLANRSGKQDLS
ncbi:MAG TPA: response regulator [Candidatus Angelobacter sp.]|nr:response regulator [Candidatus Angelobacter sp.]